MNPFCQEHQLVYTLCFPVQPLCCFLSTILGIREPSQGQVTCLFSIWGISSLACQPQVTKSLTLSSSPAGITSQCQAGPCLWSPTQLSDLPRKCRLHACLPIRESLSLSGVPFTKTPLYPPPVHPSTSEFTCGQSLKVEHVIVKIILQHCNKIASYLVGFIQKPLMTWKTPKLFALNIDNRKMYV